MLKPAQYFANDIESMQWKWKTIAARFTAISNWQMNKTGFFEIIYCLI